MNNQEQKTIYNPDNEDYTTTYDINEDKKPLSYTINALSSGSFPTVVADHIKKHLANRLAVKSGKKNYELAFKEALGKIEYDLF